MIYRLSIEEGRVLFDEQWPRPPADGLYKLVRDKAEERRRLKAAREFYERARRTDPGGNIQL